MNRLLVWVLLYLLVVNIVAARADLSDADFDPPKPAEPSDPISSDSTGTNNTTAESFTSDIKGVFCEGIGLCGFFSKVGDAVKSVVFLAKYVYAAAKFLFVLLSDPIGAPLWLNLLAFYVPWSIVVVNIGLMIRGGGPGGS